jgi:glycosyltransferase involved in cell wall biosynthesis
MNEISTGYDTPRVSVGVPVYNGERYLEEALDSILSQTFNDYELIISDNASNDRTEVICRNYAGRDRRVRYYRSPENRGAPWNFNRVFELSRGEYFRWHCADDFIDPELLQKCVNVLDNNPEVILCYPSAIRVDVHGKFITYYDSRLDLRYPSAKDRFHHFYRNVGLCIVQYGLIRSNVLRKTSLFGNYIGSDIVFLAELTLYGLFFEIPEYLFYVRLHPQASTSITSIEELKYFYDPKNRSKFYMRYWRHMWEKFKVIEKSPLTNREKKILFYMVFRDAISNRGVMLSEIVQSIKTIFNYRE